MEKKKGGKKEGKKEGKKKITITNEELLTYAKTENNQSINLLLKQNKKK